MADMQIVFWKDKGNKIMAPTLFSEQADWWAQEVFKESTGESGRDDVNKPTQLRRFYDEVLRFSAALRIGGVADQEEFDRQLPYIRMLNAKTRYAKARKHVSDSFVKMIDNCVKEVKTPEDVEAFKSFFEAFMGYYRGYHPKNN